MSEFSNARKLANRVRTIRAEDFGAVGDGATDDYAAIQAALDYAYSIGGADVEVTNTGSDYLISLPLRMRSYCGLIGLGKNKEKVKIRKTTFATRSDIGSIAGADLTVDYDTIDALILLTPEAGGYCRNVTIENLYLYGYDSDGTKTTLNDNGIYGYAGAPYSRFRNLRIDFTDLGIKWFGWVSELEGINTNGNRGGIIKMVSSVMKNCYHNAGTWNVSGTPVAGWEFQNCSYSQAVSVACDNALGSAYAFYGCTAMTLSGGCEQGTATNLGLINIRASRVTLQNFAIFSPTYSYTSGDPACFWKVSSSGTDSDGNAYSTDTHVNLIGCSWAIPVLSPTTPWGTDVIWSDLTNAKLNIIGTGGNFFSLDKVQSISGYSGLTASDVYDHTGFTYITWSNCDGDVPTSLAIGSTTSSLQHFSEGTWTPTLLDSIDGSIAGSLASSTLNGRFQRIGNRVHVDATVVFNMSSNPHAGKFRIGNLPLGGGTAIAAAAAMDIGGASNTGSAASLYARAEAAQYVEFHPHASGAETTLLTSSFLTGVDVVFIINGSYVVS